MLFRYGVRRYCCHRACILSRQLQVRNASAATVARPRKASQALPETPARTRFAPSPTGYLHLGSLRTALFNYLLAKATNGQFLLRVEDTDKTRTVSGAEDRLYEDLRWAGLQWDEGPQVGGPYGPYRQSERKDVYQSHANQLLTSGKAYRCFCSEAKLGQLAEQRSKLGLPTNYDRTCSEIPKDESNQRAAEGESYTIRFRSPHVFPIYHDLVYGKVGTSKLRRKGRLQDEAYDDFILLKSDGMPTYHLANVVDDHLMRITHVVRATEWMPSTPKHLAIYEAFQWEPPAFAHVGLLVDSKAQKLSKRDSSASLQTFVEEGVFPEALTNYLALLGWSHQLKSDFLPMQALVQSFDLKFTKGNTVFDLKKLKYLQQLFARKYIEEGGPEFRGLIQSTCDMIHRHVDPSNLYVPSNHSLESYVAAILRADATHSSEPNAFLLRNLPFFEKDLVRDLPVNLEVKGLHQIVTKAIDKLSAIPQSDWSAPTLKAAIETLDLDKSQADSGRKLYASGDLETDEKARKTANAQISRVLRWAIMAGKPGPPMVSTMGILGRECTIERLQQAQSDV